MVDRARMALVMGAALVASGIAITGHAQPAGSGSGSGSGDTDIEMEPEPAGSAKSAPAPTPPPAPAPAPAPTPPPVPAAGPGSDAAPSAPVKDPKVAKKWLSAAQQLVQKGDYYTSHGKLADAKPQYENAVTAFGKAIEAGDDIAVTYQLAIVEDKLGNVAAAYKHLKLVVDPKANAKPDVVKKAQAKLDEVTGKVGVVTLTITPPGTQVTLNGEQIGEAPMTEPLVFAPGTYTLSLSAVGFQPKDAEIKVEAGSESERKIELEPVPVVVKPVEPEEPSGPAAVAKGPDMLPLYIGAGATGALVVTGTITGILAISRHSTFTNPKTSTADRKDAQSSGRTLAHVTDICYVGALGAAAFTVYWYLYKYQPEREKQGEHTASKVRPVPWVQSSAGGMAVVGAF